jgi:hypothetical protein
MFCCARRIAETEDFLGLSAATQEGWAKPSPLANESALWFQDVPNLAVEMDGIFGSGVNQLGPFSGLFIERCLFQEVGGLNYGLERVAEVMSEAPKMLYSFIIPFCSVHFS